MIIGGQKCLGWGQEKNNAWGGDGMGVDRRNFVHFFLLPSVYSIKYRMFCSVNLFNLCHVIYNHVI